MALNKKPLVTTLTGDYLHKRKSLYNVHLYNYKQKQKQKLNTRIS